jgi:hypothetical protein
VLIAAKDDGQNTLPARVLEPDRTAYGSYYGFGELFRFLGHHLINDHMHMDMKIQAVRI